MLSEGRAGVNLADFAASTVPTVPSYLLILARWWILFMFSLLAVMQAASWNFYGPISKAITEVYGWDDNQITWLANTANISLFIALPFMSMAIDFFGLRPTVLLAAIFLFLCTALRCIATIPAAGLEPTSKATLILSYLSMVFNGLAGTLMNFLAPVISFYWFPVEQRALSTGIMSAAAPIGVAFGFLVGPSIVPRHVVDPAFAINTLFWGEAAMSVIITLCILFYFPSKPLVAPTASAAYKEQTESTLGGGYKKIFSCTRQSNRLLLISIIFGLMNGIYGGWGAVLNQNLERYNISQDDASWLGFGLVVIGCLGGIIVGFLSDRLVGKIKALILLNLALAWVCFTWFTLIILGYARGNKPSIYISLLGAGLFINTPTPLFFELALETAYPEIEEGSAASLLSLSSTLMQILFLANAFTPQTDTTWMNWMIMATPPVCIFLLILVRAQYTRLGSDLAERGRQVHISRIDDGGWL